MGNGWSEERKQRQALMIQEWKPWQHSTGPKSCEGKQRAAKNAYKGEEWRLLREKIKRLKRLMKDQRMEMEEVDSNFS